MCSLDKDGKCHSYSIGTNGQKFEGSPGYTGRVSYSQIQSRGAVNYRRMY